MGKHIKKIYEMLKAFTITIFIFCGILTIIILYYAWIIYGSKQALTACILGTIGCYHFIKLIYNLTKIKQKGEEQT